MPQKQYETDRPALSADIRRAIEVEAGHACSVKGCNEHSYLEIHHINENREDNTFENLILLCDKHHKMAHAKIIDRKALREYKKLLSTLKIGISSSDVKRIAFDVFEVNFLKLANEAAEIAQKRVEQFIDRLLVILSEQAPGSLEAFNDPDMQYSLFIAQKEYARTGNEDQAEMLVNLLVDRAKEIDRTLKQIVLNEAITVAPKLTVNQYDILSVIFLVRNINLPEPDLAQLIDQIEFIISILSSHAEMRGSVLHLQYTGCCAVQESKSISEIVRESYSSLFYKGFEKEKFYSVFPSREQAIQFGNKILIPCLHNPELWQPKLFKQASFEFDELIKEMNIEGKTVVSLQRFFGSYIMSSQEVNFYLYEVIPEFNKINTTWFMDNMDSMKLTSVGIAIAQANLRRRFNFEFGNLAMWLY